MDQLFATVVSPSPDTIRRTAEAIVSRPEYELEATPSGQSPLVWLLLKILEWLLKPIVWLAEQLDWMPAGLRWVVVGALLLLVVALVVHIVWSIVVSLRPRQHGGMWTSEDTRADPDELEREAERIAAEGDLPGAVRTLFRSVLLRLEQLESRRFSPGTTNREHLRRLASSPFHDEVRTLVETIDATWYGTGRCSEGDYVACRRAAEEIRRGATGRAHALGA